MRTTNPQDQPTIINYEQNKYKDSNSNLQTWIVQVSIWFSKSDRNIHRITCSVWQRFAHPDFFDVHFMRSCSQLLLKSHDQVIQCLACLRLLLYGGIFLMFLVLFWVPGLYDGCLANREQLYDGFLANQFWQDYDCSNPRPMRI